MILKKFSMLIMGECQSFSTFQIEFHFQNDVYSPTIYHIYSIDKRKHKEMRNQYACLNIFLLKFKSDLTLC